MAKKPNYGFEKRRKELDRKTKKEEKEQRKRDRAAAEQDASVEPRPDEDTQSPTA